MFEQLLAEPALETGQSEAAHAYVQAPQVRFLVLKNYAAALATENVTSERALQLYIEAASVDTTDTVLWHSLGSLVGHNFVQAVQLLCLQLKSGFKSTRPVCRQASLATGMSQDKLLSQA